MPDEYNALFQSGLAEKRSTGTRSAAPAVATHKKFDRAHRDMLVAAAVGLTIMVNALFSGLTLEGCLA